MASASSPMREALAQLASQGLVQRSNHRGFRVPPLNAAHPVDVLLGELADRRHRTSARSVKTQSDAGPGNRAPAAQACRLFWVGLIGWDKIARILRLERATPKTSSSAWRVSPRSSSSGTWSGSQATVDGLPLAAGGDALSANPFEPPCVLARKHWGRWPRFK